MLEILFDLGTLLIQHSSSIDVTVNSFLELDLNQKLQESLKANSFTKPTEIQAKMIPEGLKKKDILFKRPGTGIFFKDLKRILGKKTKRSLPINHQINFKDFN